MNAKSVKKTSKTTIKNGVKTIETTIITKEGNNITEETVVETITGDNNHMDHYNPTAIDNVPDEFKDVFKTFDKNKKQFEGFQKYDKLGSTDELPKQPKENVPSGVEFIDGSLDRHNYYRKMHKVCPLVHNPDLTKMAQKYADKLASMNKMQHSDCKWGKKQVGENLAMCGGYVMTPDHSCDMWYDEIQDYNWKNPGFQKGTGHFTQVVWKDSEEAGFGIAQSKNGSWYSVANYYPAGNFMGRFEKNVFPK